MMNLGINSRHDWHDKFPELAIIFIMLVIESLMVSKNDEVNEK